MNVTRRSVIRAGLSAVITPGVALAAASTARALDLGTVISRHTTARGGARALEAVHSMSAVLWITEKASTIVAHYRCTNAPAFRIDIYADAKHVFCEGLDADGPWIWPGGAPEPKSGVADAKRTALEGIEFNLYGLHSFAQRGHALTLRATERIEGTDLIVIQVDLKDSYRTFLYLDPANYMIVRRRDERAFHPDVDATRRKIETQYTDFRTVSGVRSSFVDHQVNLADGKIVQVSALQDLAYNPSWAPDEMTRHFVQKG
jgi:hypothetical protein